MVLIAEISDEALRKRGEAKGGCGEMAGEVGVVGAEEEEEAEKDGERTLEPRNVEEPPAEAALKEFKEAAPPPCPGDGKVVHNEYALRVAYIMRSFLHMRQGGGGGGGGGAAAAASPASAAIGGGCGVGEERCRAMMEVVRKENGRWSVSRVALDHSHPLAPPPDPAGTLSSGRLVPAVGMEFDSVSAAKAYYAAYSEKMGFTTNTGSGKRSKVSRILLMQRFMCSKGTFPVPSDGAAMKKKRGPYKKRDHREAEEAKKKDAEVVEVIAIENNSDKDGAANGVKGATLAEKVANSGKISAELGNRNKGEKVPLVSNPGQSRLLRELGIKVSRYSHEERRDIIMKYMQKRSSRQVVDRSIKVVFSMQALLFRKGKMR